MMFLILYRKGKALFPCLPHDRELVEEGGHLPGKKSQWHFPLAKDGLAPILLPP